MDTTPQTLTERLAAAIADAILAGELLPGARLDEQSLAERFGVSRTPVREALRQLGTGGLIDVRPRRGATVSSVTPELLEELFVAMGEIEATCARLSALSMTPIERRRLADLHGRMGEDAQAGRAEAYAASNVRFHGAVYAGAHNATLAEMAAGLRRRLSPYRQAQFRAAGRLPRSHAEHGEVVAAILRGDAAGAHAAMLHHVSLVEDAFEQLSRAVSGKGQPAIRKAGLVAPAIR